MAEIYHPPFDLVAYRYDVVGVKLTEAGISLQSTIKLLNAKGEVVTANSDTKQGKPPFGTARICIVSGLLISSALPAGPYTMVLSVTDNNSSETTTCKRKIHLDGSGPAICFVKLTYDQEGKTLASPTLALGQSLYYQFGAIGMGLDHGQINCEYTTQLLQASTGQPVSELQKGSLHVAPPVHGASTRAVAERQFSRCQCPRGIHPARTSHNLVSKKSLRHMTSRCM